MIFQCNSLVLEYLVVLCKCCCYLISRHFLHRKKKPNAHYPSLPSPLGTANLLSISVRFLNLLSIYLPILDILYKQNHTMAFCVWLPLLDTMFWRFIYIVVSISTSFCSQIRFHYMNISFIHSLVDEHLNYLPFWIILNDMNTGVQIFI